MLDGSLSASSSFNAAGRTWLNSGPIEPHNLFNLRGLDVKVLRPGLTSSSPLLSLSSIYLPFCTIRTLLRTMRKLQPPSTFLGVSGKWQNGACHEMLPHCWLCSLVRRVPPLTYFRPSHRRLKLETWWLPFRPLFKFVEGWVTLAHSSQPTLFPNKSFLGRGSPSIVKTKMTAPVSGPCRVGDFDVTSDDLPTVGRQRLRQVRRLISARHQLARADNSPLALSSFYDTWSAILQAVCFSDFAWNNWGTPVPPTPTKEDLALLGLLAHTATNVFSAWHSEWIQAKKNKFAAHVSGSLHIGGRALFQAIRPPPRPEISVLEIPIPARIRRHRRSKKGPFVVSILQPDQLPDNVVAVESQGERISIVRADFTLHHRFRPTVLKLTFFCWSTSHTVTHFLGSLRATGLTFGTEFLIMMWTRSCISLIRFPPSLLMTHSSPWRNFNNSFGNSVWVKLGAQMGSPM